MLERDTAGVIEDDTLRFEHGALKRFRSVVCALTDLTLRVDDAVPWNVFSLRASEGEQGIADLARMPRSTRENCDLTIGCDATVRNVPDNVIDRLPTSTN